VRRIVIGVMGSGDPIEDPTVEIALGKAIAKEGWVLLSGGRNSGVMDAVNQGARDGNGLTIGILPDENKEKLSKHVDVAIVTDMGNARNNINVLSSNVVIACGEGGAGTASEIALALKSKKPVVLLNTSQESVIFFSKIGNKAGEKRLVYDKKMSTKLSAG
jgi:uncharacterized protein (TIGR00725 family)